MIFDPDGAEHLTRVEFWERVAAISFGAWAIAVPAAARWIVVAIHKLIDRMDALITRFDEYKIEMEGRVTKLETNQHNVMHTLDRLQYRLTDDGK